MPDRPNILFILTDQQRRDSLAAYGNDWIEAPNNRRSRPAEHRLRQRLCDPAGLYSLPRFDHDRHVIHSRPGSSATAFTCGTTRPPSPRWSRTTTSARTTGSGTSANDLIPQHGFEDWRSIEDWHLTAGTSTRKEHRFLESDYNAWLRSHGVEPPSGESYETWFPTAGLSAELTQAGYLGGEASRFIREHGESPSPRPTLHAVHLLLRAASTLHRSLK